MFGSDVANPNIGTEGGDDVGTSNRNTNSTGASGSTNAASRRKKNDLTGMQLSNPKNYEGSIPEVGCILALRH